MKARITYVDRHGRLTIRETAFPEELLLELLRGAVEWQEVQEVPERQSRKKEETI